jgi:hypothetical protein
MCVFLLQFDNYSDPTAIENRCNLGTCGSSNSHYAPPPLWGFGGPTGGPKTQSGFKMRIAGATVSHVPKLKIWF